jgi:hypothetical protein
MACSISELTPDERRRESLFLAHQLLAPALLRSEQPDERGKGLLSVALVDAVMAGDRLLIHVACQVLDRLEHYLPENAPRTDVWRGRFRASCGGYLCRSSA